MPPKASKRPKVKQASPLGEVLERLLSGELKHLLYLRILKAWEQFCPPEYQGEVYPLGIRKGILTLTVTHPTVSHQLQFEKETILAVLNEALQEEAVIDLRFQVGKMPPRLQGFTGISFKGQPVPPE